MNTGQIMLLVAASCWLLIAIRAYRAHDVNLRKSLVMALIWGAIFLGVTLLILATR